MINDDIGIDIVERRILILDMVAVIDEMRVDGVELGNVDRVGGQELAALRLRLILRFARLGPDKPTEIGEINIFGWRRAST
ncbi:MAG: hypothetical protein AAYR33_10785 [Acetobacteraceae bacterium]